LSTGIISAKGRGSGRALQTDANISPANYGGPLIDIEGRVMGICVPLNPTAPGPAAGVEWYDSGIGFAIPISTYEKWLSELKEGQDLEFGFLGLNVKNHEGQVTVEGVREKSPAEEAGVAQEDQILQLNGVKIKDTAQLGVELRRYLAGDTVQLELQRGTEMLSVEVILGQSPSSTPEIPPVQITPVQPEAPNR
jgi:serine protease Do